MGDRLIQCWVIFNFDVLHNGTRDKILYSMEIGFKRSRKLNEKKNKDCRTKFKSDIVKKTWFRTTVFEYFWFIVMLRWKRCFGGRILIITFFDWQRSWVRRTQITTSRNVHWLVILIQSLNGIQYLCID